MYSFQHPSAYLPSFLEDKFKCNFSNKIASPIYTSSTSNLSVLHAAIFTKSLALLFLRDTRLYYYRRQRTPLGPGKMALMVKIFSANHEVLGLIPRTHMAEEES